MPQELYRKTREEYEKERKTGFTEDQFVSLISAFPAVYITTADGVFHTGEKRYLQEVAKSMASVYEEDGLSEEETELLAYRFYAEFDYLYWHRARWETPFLKILADYLKHYPSDKKQITQMIMESAKASHEINSSELAGINEIKEILGIK